MPAQQPNRRHPDRPEELAAFDLSELTSAGALYAAVVREARREAGVSRDELAERTDVPTQVVALWEDPSWEGHSLSVLRRVARALGSRLELRIAPARKHVGAKTSVSAA